VKHTKNQRNGALDDMIDKIEFSAKNLTSNAGVLLLFNYTEEYKIFQEPNENLISDNKRIEEIKMNRIKTLICDELKTYIIGFMRSGNIYTYNGTAKMII